MMPEPSDFEQLAQTLIHEAAMVVGALAAGTDCLPARRSIDKLLRQVWNARGAADREKLEAVYSGPFTKLQDRQLLDRALRSLDR